MKKTRLKTNNRQKSSLITDRMSRPLGSAQVERPKTCLDTRPLSANAKNTIPVVTNVKEKRSKNLKCVIIGSGAAGSTCLDTLREYGFTDLVVITEDSHLPYDRPKLSKKLSVNFDECALRDENYFKNQVNIKYNACERVEAVDFDMKTVKCFGKSDLVNYDKLVISTGLKPNGIKNTPDGIFSTLEISLVSLKQG